MTFKAGDPVWVAVMPGHSELGNPGELPAVVAGPSFMDKTWYRINIEGHGDGWHSDGKRLRPRRPPDEKREELGEWELCPWQPTKEKALRT